MKIALVGAPAAGKTTLLCALTGHDYQAAVTSQATGKPREGHAKVPDPRVGRLAEKWHPKKTTHALLDFADSLPIFFSGPERERNREALAAARETDGLVVVLGDYGDPALGGTDALLKALDQFRAEFIVSDLDTIEKRIEKLEVSTKRPTPFRDTELKELAVLKRFKEALEGNRFVSTVKLSLEEAKLVRGFRFLSEKPLVVALNVGESRTGNQQAKVAALAAKEVPAVSLCARLELELLQMEGAERASFMADYGVTAFAVHDLVAACYRALGLVSFLTMGEDECRAWTIHRGDDAVTAAGKIHTDLAKGFIAAEVVHFEDWAAAGGVLKDVKAHGRFRTEGRGYVVQDGDILNVKFNV